MAKKGASSEKKRPSSSRKGSNKKKGGGPSTPSKTKSADLPGIQQQMTGSPNPGVSGQDVYGDLFNLGPATAYGPEDPMGGSAMSNPVLFFNDDAPCPVPTSSWDVLPPMQDPRPSTPMSNFGSAGQAVGPSPASAIKSDHLDHASHLAASPYDPYYVSAQPNYGHDPYGGAGPSGAQITDTYTPMGSYGQGPYSGRMRYSHQQHDNGAGPGGAPYAMAPMQGPGPYGHPHHQQVPPGPDFMRPMHAGGGHGLPTQDPHRAMSHYAASGLPPGPMSASLSSSAQGVPRDKGRGFDPSPQAQAAAQGAGGGAQGKPGEGAGAESSKKRKSAAGLSASPSREDVTAGGQAGPSPAQQQQMADQNSPYLQQPQYRSMGLDPSGMQTGPGPPYYPPQGYGPHQGAPGQVQYPGAPMGHKGPGWAHRMQVGFPDGGAGSGGSGAGGGAQAAPQMHQLSDRDLTSYVRPMVSQLQTIISLLDVNTKKTIADSLVRLATAKNQGGSGNGAGGAAQQTAAMAAAEAGALQSETKHDVIVQNMLDRSICQLLYNTRPNDPPAL